MNRRDMLKAAGASIVAGALPAPKPTYDERHIVGDMRRLASLLLPVVCDHPDAWKVIDAIAARMDRMVGLTELCYGLNPPPR
jgi:hypothetical protein